MNPTPRAPIALMTCESGRNFAQTVADHMGLPLIPTEETWFACGEGKLAILRLLLPELLKLGIVLAWNHETEFLNSGIKVSLISIPVTSDVLFDL